MVSYGMSDIGKVRKINEDSFHISSDSEIFYCIVADGMGGHNAGEVASKMATDIVSAYIEENKYKNCEDILTGAFRLANKKIYEKAIKDASLERMGTTLLCAIASEGKMYIGHVGDSSAYIIKDNNIIKITKDHTIVRELLENGQITEAEAKNHPQRNVITRAIGTDKTVVTDIYIGSNDGIFVMATDGLTGMVDDEDIKDVVLKLGIKNATKTLIDIALKNGGTDNITIIIFSADKNSGEETK